MMHHPNMHHQAMSGHPPQHMPAHQPIPAHHQIPPHQMHRENRHVAITRVGLGGGQTSLGPGMAAVGVGMGVGVGVHHAPAPRPPHAIRAMHHPPTHHHTIPPQQMKPMRRPYVSSGYGGVMAPPYAQPPPPPVPLHTPATTQTASTTTGVSGVRCEREAAVESCGAAGASETAVAGAGADERAAGDPEAARPLSAQANSKEKTPMCLVNELARYNKIKHQYRLTSETGPAHKKVFTVTLRLGDTEEYTAEGSSIKRAQHAAASAALGATGFTAPPPRAQPPHAPAHAHHRHAGAVMPTVELNALAMKLCQPAVYTSVPAVAGAAGPAAGPAGGRLPRGRAAYRLPFVPYPRLLGPGLLYRVRVCVGGRAWLGEGGTPQAARHDAAARALQDLRPPPENPPAPPQQTVQHDTENGDVNGDLLNSEVKSPVSLVHELALKRNLTVQFTVKSERGPPHMRVFITACTVGDMETEGEGNGKKVSKRRAAERMLEEVRRRWPPALLRPRLPHDKRRHQPTKKKPRNLIKEGVVESGTTGGCDNPISRLAVARHAVRARSPQYRVLEERGAARRREFLVQCDAPPHTATGLGPNKKTAKRRAAHNVLLAMEMSTPLEEPVSSPSTPDQAAVGSPDAANNTDSKRKDSDGPLPGAGGDGRQPVPGVLLMDYHHQPHQHNSTTETSATSGSGGNTPGAKDKLMYLSQLLGFTVQFSDFPKRNHGEYLSLVSLSTEPPVMCHGGGPSTGHSHEQCSRAALRALALMGLDAPQGKSGASPLPSTISNGVAE